MRRSNNNNFIVFGLTRSGLEPTIYRTCGKHANHYTTDAVAQVNIKIFAINPDLNENKEMYLLTCLWISDFLYIFKNPVTWYNIVTL
jgi:hypothetical protein